MSATPQQWQIVKRILAGALEREPSQRSAYLDLTCTDPALRREVESLIAAEEETHSGSLDTPAAEVAKLKAGARLGSYKIAALLGAGGMGEVYQAHDTKLGRDVALKVLPPAFVNDPDRLARFQREARILASLNHPNIATLHGLEEADGIHYLVMELVSGRTLAGRLTTGALSVQEALRIARQVAEALTAAHAKGVMHRDLKPANVKVTPEGRVKVLDFGLAKGFVDEAASTVTDLAAVSQSETFEGNIVGTPAYMSPEQARGKRLDKRTDIWSFGCLLYELLTGKRAFRGENTAETIAKIIEREPDWTAFPPATPVRVRLLLQKCLQKDPEQRLPDIADAQTEIEEAQRQALAGPLGAFASIFAGRRGWAIAASFMAVLVLGAGSLAIRPVRERIRERLSSTIIPQEKQLAVLPFEIVGGNPVSRAFGDGLTETLTAQLAQLTTRHTLSVVPASEVRARKVTSSKGARQELGVNLILTGSLEQAGAMARVNYELVDTKTDRQLRADTVTIASADPFTGEDKVVESVIRMLRLELEPSERVNLESHGTQMADAYDLYLEGRGYLQNYDKVENLESALKAFRAALALDQNYALAYTGLGQTYWLKYQDSKDPQWVQPAREACEHGLALDQRLASAHVCLGTIASGTGQYGKAVEEFAIAGEAEPTTDDAFRGLGEAYQNLGNLAEAEKTYRRAIALRPHYWAPYNWLGVFYFRQARFADAAGMFDQVVNLAPDSFRGYANLGAALNGGGSYREAIAASQRSIAIRPTDTGYTNLGNAYFYLRQYDEAARAQEQAVKLKEHDYLLWFNLGEAYYWNPAKRAQASAAYRRAVELGQERLRVNPKETGTIGIVAVCESMLGEQRAAIQYVRQGLRLAPNDPEMLFDAAQVFNQSGDVNSTLRGLDKALAAGYSQTIVRDSPNFDPLRPIPHFQELVRVK